ncbi:MAG: CvpA family protein [Fibrobacter sp.]|jgi:membrane protein required for colicin V production|nr:CvpA family protein [Fibrobacter sp.]
MHTLDLAILIIASIFTVIGIKRGFIGEVIRLAAMISGFIIGFLYFKDLSRVLPLDRIPLHIKNAISFLLIYIAVVLILISIGWALKKIVRLVLLGWLDRMLGALIGLAKAVLIAWAVCLSISSFPARSIQSDFQKSYVYRSYKKLPEALSLKGINKTRSSIKSIQQKKPDKEIQKKQKTGNRVVKQGSEI